MKTQHYSTKVGLPQGFFNLILVFSVFYILLSTSSCQGENSIYKFKTAINTNMNITKSLSISIITPHLIIGSKTGYLKIFDIKTGNLHAYMNQ